VIDPDKFSKQYQMKMIEISAKREYRKEEQLRKQQEKTTFKPAINPNSRKIVQNQASSGVQKYGVNIQPSVTLRTPYSTASVTNQSVQLSKNLNDISISSSTAERERVLKGLKNKYQDGRTLSHNRDLNLNLTDRLSTIPKTKILSDRLQDEKFNSTSRS
jgi:hypothetical protein